MRRAVLALCLIALPGAIASGSLAACSSASGGGTSTKGDASAGGEGGMAGDAGAASFVPEIACADTLDSIYADPGDVSAKPKGAILRCAKDSDMSIADLTAAVDVTTDGGNIAYSGKPFTSGAHVYRVLYRTTRGDPKSSPGYSSALVFLPDHPRHGVGTALPVVVSAHGSRGQAGKCAPSHSDPAAADVEEDFQHQVYPLVGLGYAVIAPDLAGYANFGGANNPPPTYSNALDVGRSFLDGARALRNLIPHSVTQQIAFTGHSQGGSTVFDALASADSYGADGIISAVAVYSPLWFSQRSYAAIFYEPMSYGFAENGSAGPVSIWYHYSTSYLLDGPDAALELFNPAKAAVVQSFFDNDCWTGNYPDLREAGASANDFFTSAYVNSITSAAIPLLGNGDCAGDPVCQKWLDRLTADYPHLTGGAAKVPILVYYANGDNTISPDLMQCVFNRLTADQTKLKVCYDTNPVGHGGVVAQNASNIADWIEAQTSGDGGAPSLSNCSTLADNDSGVPQLLTVDGGVQLCNPLVATQ